MSKPSFDDRYAEASLEVISSMRESEFSYWNSILTYNTIIISVFSAVSIEATHYRDHIIILVLLSIASSYLMLSNFYYRRRFYARMARLIQMVKADPSRANEYKSEHERGNRKMQIKEMISYYLVFPQFVMILWILIPGPFDKVYNWLFIYFYN